MDNCIFCKIASGEVATNVIYEDSEIIAFYDHMPMARIHALVIPKRHIVSLGEVSPDDAPLIGKLALKCADIARELGIDGDGYRVYTNIGKNGGQDVGHLHFHLLGGEKLNKNMADNK